MVFLDFWSPTMGGVGLGGGGGGELKLITHRVIE